MALPQLFLLQLVICSPQTILMSLCYVLILCHQSKHKIRTMMNPFKWYYLYHNHLCCSFACSSSTIILQTYALHNIGVTMVAPQTNGHKVMPCVFSLLTYHHSKNQQHNFMVSVWLLHTFYDWGVLSAAAMLQLLKFRCTQEAGSEYKN